MRNRAIALATTLLICITATACSRQAAPAPQDTISSPQESLSQEAAPPPAEGGEQGHENITDVGSMLFPGHTAALEGRIVDGKLLIWSEGGSVFYDYETAQTLYTSPLEIQPLGTEHFYSQERMGENSYKITLYGKAFEVLAQHESEAPAFPAIDGKTLLYDQRKITTLNTETGATTTFAVQDADPQYTGGVWVYEFDGEWVFFATTCNPTPGNPGVGAYNVLTGDAIFNSDFSSAFCGVPVCFGQNEALFWQGGSAYGTDGTYCVKMDTASGEIRNIDVGEVACRISDNGQYLVAVSGKLSEGDSTPHLTAINTYGAETLEPRYSQSVELPISVDSGVSFGGLSISNDGQVICLGAVVDEGGETRQTVLLYSTQ